MLIYDVKLEALRLRRAIEKISVDVWVNASGLSRHTVSSGLVERRLVLLIAKVSDARRLEAFRTVRQAGLVYRETSDVLHGRLKGARFQDTQLNEWRSDCLRLEVLWESLK